MRYISHRGHISGIISEKENHPDYIKEALNQGFDVEIDVRLINKEWWLGHDEPQFKVNFDFLKIKNLWIHSKTVETFSQLVDHYDINTFYHNTDDVTLTSRGWLWTYPGKPLYHHFSVAVLPELVPGWQIQKAGAICSDYIAEFKKDVNFKL